MSVGPLGGWAGSVAGTPLAQTKGSEVERTQQDLRNQQRRVQNNVRAENAAGIGEADGEDHHPAERDADGRRSWAEAPAPRRPSHPSRKESLPSGGARTPQERPAVCWTCPAEEAISDRPSAISFQQSAVGSPTTDS